MSANIELRGAVHLDQMQPQFAATIAANSDGYFPVAGESAFWLEVRPGIVVNRLLDIALKRCDVTPGALMTERHYGSLEVHSSDQGQVLAAGREILELCVEAGGVITGEHGVGSEKRDFMGLVFDDDDLEPMLSLRATFDPENVCNPGKLIPTTRFCAESNPKARGYDAVPFE